MSNLVSEDISKIENLLNELYSCMCNTELDKETGCLPPDSNDKNWFGEPVWANEICIYCKLKFLIKELKNKINQNELPNCRTC